MRLYKAAFFLGAFYNKSCGMSYSLREKISQKSKVISTYWRRLNTYMEYITS